MARKAFNISEAVADLAEYGEKCLGLQPMDKIYAVNQLLSLFNIDVPAAPSTELHDLQTKILDPIVKYAVKQGMIKENESLLFETKLMGFVTPSPGTVIAEFDNIAANTGIEDATQYLNNLAVKSNYIRKIDIDKNIKWTAPGEMGDLTVTINLSKPEKDNKQVALEKSLPQTGYPKCMLCVENVGFAGTLRHPARQTLRTIPVVLAKEEWHFQFSPYVYYDNHCIALSAEHRPMHIDAATFVRLFDFAELFPHYFIGSNADLPIVGGSILSHDHFQGGKKVLPMLSRGARKTFTHPDFPDVEISILDWYNSVIRLKSDHRGQLEDLAAFLLGEWKDYSDEENNIIASTDGVPHNTVTPVAAMQGKFYHLYLILRNNRTDAAHPFGIFHPTEDMHNIKKEGIGLIEAMGIFILPGRLFEETKEIVSILTGETPLDFAALAKEEHPLCKHIGMIAQLSNDFGLSLDPEKAESAVVTYINRTCIKILNCTAVFKNTQEGQRAFERFLKNTGAK